MLITDACAEQMAGLDAVYTDWFTFYIKEGMMDREKSREGELRSKIVFFFSLLCTSIWFCLYTTCILIYVHVSSNIWSFDTQMVVTSTPALYRAPCSCVCVFVCVCVCVQHLKETCQHSSLNYLCRLLISLSFSRAVSLFLPLPPINSFSHSFSYAFPLPPSL